MTPPVAVDGHGDEEQHRHEHGGDDDGERDFQRWGVVHRIHDPPAVTELHLETSGTEL